MSLYCDSRRYLVSYNSIDIFSAHCPALDPIPQTCNVLRQSGQRDSQISTHSLYFVSRKPQSVELSLVSSHSEANGLSHLPLEGTGDFLVPQMCRMMEPWPVIAASMEHIQGKLRTLDQPLFAIRPYTLF